MADLTMNGPEWAAHLGIPEGGAGSYGPGLCPFEGCGARHFWIHDHRDSKGWNCSSCERKGVGFDGLEVVGQYQGAVLVNLADVEPEHVRWLWPGRIPRGRLTILDGDPGLGKSAITIDLTARVTRGDLMPDGVRGLGSGAGVVLLGCEDGLADTVRPRLDAAGADVSRVVALQAVRDSDGRPRLPTVGDTGAIEAAAQTVEAALLVVDPLSAFLGRIDGHRDTDVRQALAGLAALAERTGLAVLAVRHLSKSGGGNPLYRGGGSIAIIAAARSGLLLVKDPEDDDLRVLASTKNNLAPPQPSLMLRLDSSGEALRVEWLETTERSAGELLSSDSDREHRSVRDEAVEMLRAELENGPRTVPALRKAAKSAGVSWRTLERAKQTLRVMSKPTGFGGAWAWSLPASEVRQPTWRTSEMTDLADFAKSQRLHGVSADDTNEVRQAQTLADFGEIEAPEEPTEEGLI
jgi:hypothetical protein